MTTTLIVVQIRCLCWSQLHMWFVWTDSVLWLSKSVMNSGVTQIPVVFVSGWYPWCIGLLRAMTTRTSVPCPTDTKTSMVSCDVTAKSSLLLDSLSNWYEPFHYATCRFRWHGVGIGWASGLWVTGSEFESWPWQSYLHLRGSATKQYNLVAAKEQWCSSPGK